MSYLSDKSIYVTGCEGFLGTRLWKALPSGGKIVGHPHSRLDLLDEQAAMLALSHNYDIIFHLAAEVGGIGANKAEPGRFFYTNMRMGLNVIESARLNNVPHVVLVGTVCSYPRLAKPPFQPWQLFTGYPESTNAPYGIAKAALGVMLQAYHRQYGMAATYVIPTNLYGPGDNFDQERSHVIPALIRKFDEALESDSDTVILWGTGQATRDFLYVDDAADGILCAAEHSQEGVPLNLGSGSEIKIADLAVRIADMMGYRGRILYDSSQPDGQPRRRVDNWEARQFGWQSKIELDDGLNRTITWWRQHRETNACV